MNRRTALGLAAGATMAAAVHATTRPAPGAVHINDIVMMDATALAAAIHTRKISCVEVMTAYLDHIEALNPKVNAIVALQDRDGVAGTGARARRPTGARRDPWDRCTAFRMR